MDFLRDTESRSHKLITANKYSVLYKMLSVPMESSAFIILYLTHKLMSMTTNAHDDRSSSLFIMIFYMVGMYSLYMVGMYFPFIKETNSNIPMTTPIILPEAISAIVAAAATIMTIISELLQVDAPPQS